jgi:hypothetical protein
MAAAIRIRRGIACAPECARPAAMTCLPLMRAGMSPALWFSAEIVGQLLRGKNTNFLVFTFCF